MKRAWAVVLVLGLSANASADDRTKWAIGLGFGAGMTVAGVATTLYGRDVMEDTHAEICARGAFVYGSECWGRPSGPPLSQAELDQLNRQGERGETLANVGLGVTLVGAIITGVSAYKLATIKPARSESGVVVAPTMNKHGAGAAVTLRW